MLQWEEQMNLRHSWVSGLTGGLAGLTLATSMLAAPAVVYAESTVEVSSSSHIGSLESSLQTTDNNELFNGYLQRLFYGDQGISLLGTSGYEQLNEREQQMYSNLLPAIQEIARGVRASTMLIPFSEVVYTASELGFSDDDLNAMTTTEKDRALLDVAVAKFKSEEERVSDALQYDHPYDFYWFDKTTGIRMRYFYDVNSDNSVRIWGAGPSSDNPQGVDDGTGFSFAVAKAYQANDETYTFNTALVSKATNAKSTADSIVAKHAGESDYQKLASYKDEICDLVAYNHEAADNDSTPYGDPWQLIYVFDGDGDTNVVCEGYAKAFQYLFDLSSFRSNLMRCTTISGEMGRVDEASEGHMWNIVRMDDGKNYLVDVTNSDTGTVGANGGLFIAPYATAETSSNKPTWYTFTTASNVTEKYTYRDDLYSMYPAEYINISDAAYTEPDEPAATDISDATVTITGSYTYTGEAIEPAADSISVTLNGTAIPAGSYSATFSNNTDAGTATVTITPNANSGYTGTATGSFTVEEKTLTPSIAGTTSKTYDGTTTVTGSGLSISLEGTVPSDDVSASASFAYTDANAGSEKQIVATDIKLAGDDAKNYRLAATSTNSNVGTIEKATPQGTVSLNSGVTLYTGTTIAAINEQLRWSGSVSGTVALNVNGSDTLEAGTHTLSWIFTPTDQGNYTNATGTIALTVVENDIIGIGITAMPTKTVYEYGDQLDTAGMTVTATYANGGTATIPVDDLTLSPTTLTQLGDQTITISYAGHNASLGVTVNRKRITPQAELIDTDNLTYTGSPLTPNAIVTNGKERLSVSEYTISYVNNTNAGTATATVSPADAGHYTFNPIKVAFSIAKAQPVLSVNAIPSGNAASGSATVTVNLAGVNTTDLNGSEVVLSVGEQSAKVTISNGSATHTFTGLAGSGNHSVSASYAGSANYREAAASVSFSLEKATPDVAVSFTGADIYPTSTIDDVRAALKVDASVAGRLEISNLTLREGTVPVSWTFTPNDPDIYNSVSGITDVTVRRDALVSIAATAPNKTSYIAGELFDPTGMIVTATYASGRTAQVSSYSYSTEPLTAGQTSVVISFADGDDSVTCNVPIAVFTQTSEATLTILSENIATQYNGSPINETMFGLQAAYGDTPAADGDLSFTYQEISATGDPVGEVTATPPRDAGNYDVTVTLANKVIDGVAYSAVTANIKLTIDKLPLSTELFSPIPEQTYTGTALEPEVIVAAGQDQLITEADYSVSYRDNNAVGTGHAIVQATEDGNFTGEVSLPFTIAASNPETPDTPDAPNPPTTPSQPDLTPAVPESSHGETTVSTTDPQENETVVVTPKPDEGFEVRNVTVTDSDGNEVEVKQNEDGTWSFEQPDSAVTITVVFGCDGGDLCLGHQFVDVDSEAWYHDPIDWAIENDVLHGYDDGSNTMGPNDSITRSQMAAMLWNLAGNPAPTEDATFTDCVDGAWYANAIAWAQEEGIFSGYSGSTNFGPEDKLTREQAAIVLWRAAGEPETETDLSVYPDADEISDYAQAAMAWVIEQGIILGREEGGQRWIAPQDTCSRAEIAAILMREALKGDAE